MKWLLITATQNVGDCFVRFGVKRLIRSVDASPVFLILDKENPETWGEVEFDRCVLCGMPLFWNHSHWSQDAPWWKPVIFGWPTARKRDFLALGVGNAFGADGIKDPHQYLDAILSVIERAWKVTTRQPTFAHPGLIESVCPASFWLKGAMIQREFRKLFNFMPDGAHESHFDPKEAAIWKNRMPALAKQLTEAGYEFIAHDEAEAELAANLKCPVIHFPKKAEAYEPFYSQCSDYVGNRLHGAVAVLGAGGRAAAIGYDSRIAMVRRIGGTTYFPSEFSLNLPLGNPNAGLLRGEFLLHFSLLDEFANREEP